MLCIFMHSIPLLSQETLLVSCGLLICQSGVLYSLLYPHFTGCEIELGIKRNLKG